MPEANEPSELEPEIQLEAEGPGGPPGRRPKTAVGAGSENPDYGLDAVRNRPGMYIGSTGAGDSG